MNSATINTDVTMADGGQALLANRYRVVKQLGQGGMGSVWLAEDTVLDNRKVAIKMLPSILFANKRAYNQLKSEALVAMKLSHSNIAAVRSFEENGGNPFIVEDYIEGQTLDAYLAEKGGTLSEDEVIRLLTPVAAALDYAHREGVVHRDVKPANVMIRKDGTPFVLDFGIAREAQETMTMVTGKLSSGTLLYMSPEQLNGALPKPAQDIYSFAAMVYECLAGQPPFCRGQIEYQIINNPPPPLGPHFINCGPVMAGLAKDPKDRPATCAAVLSPGGVSNSGGTPAPRAAAMSSSRKMLPLVALAMLLLASIGGLFAWRAHERSIAAEAREAELAQIREQAAQEKAAVEVEAAKRLADAQTETERIRKETEAAKAKLDAREKRLQEMKASVRAVPLKAGDVKTVTLPGGAKLELVYCPPGEFLMGSPETEEQRWGNEKQHRVTLTKGFWIGKYEVTQAQWKSVMGNNPSNFKGDDRPVEEVSWNDCQEFLKKAGLGLRLPTEAEWEYACRAGSKGSFAGSGRLDEMGWCDNNSGRTTCSVGQKKPNAWGLYDMHGNVWEWCQDWWYVSYDGDARDPQGPALGDGRVLRGGSWGSSARDCRSAYRGWSNAGYCGNILGFRVACSLP